MYGASGRYYSAMLFKNPSRFRQIGLSIQAPNFHSSSSAVKPPKLFSLSARPTWSVRDLLPESPVATDSPQITSKQLRHLLRLSALPAPESPEEERKMMQTLSSQLHFVKEIQSVDTTGVEPLRSIRDESAEAMLESELTVEKLQDAFNKEEVRGWSRRIERKKGERVDKSKSEDWDILGQASRKVGRYFMVETTPDK